MKDIQLCGLGNSLVDLQFEITEDELIQLGVPKGTMQLLQADKQAQLIEQLADKPNHKCSGGSAANSIIAFRQLGGKAAYMSILGKDDFGKFYLEEFNNLGINLSTSLNEEQPTGTCLVLITPDGERTMLTSLGAAALFSPVNIDEDLIKRSEWVYMEGYKFSEDSSSEAIKVASELAKKHGTKVAVTFSDIFITENFRDKISEVLKNTELIFCNEAEALSFTQTSNEDDAFAKLSEICQNVVMTRGSRGSLIKWGDKNYEISSFPVKVMDTTGAGDSFAGAFFYGISHLDSVEKAGRLASLVASKIVSQFGARYNNDMKDLLKVI